MIRDEKEYPIPRLPNPLTEDGLRNLMRERAYWDLKHPSSPLYQRLVAQGFSMLYPGKTKYDETGKAIDVPPLPPEAVAHQVTQVNREMDRLERSLAGTSIVAQGKRDDESRQPFDERPTGSREGAVHVQSHTRDGGKTEVTDHWRARPGEGGGDDTRGGTNNDGEDRAEPNTSDMREDADEDIQLAEHARARDPYPESPFAFEFRDALAKAEHSHDKSNDGYEERTRGDKALGRYQLQEDSLKDAGFKDKGTGEWTKKARDLGVNSTEDFLNNPYAQEIALRDSTAAKDGFLESNGAKMHIGQAIEGIEAKFEITEAGLAAAAHRRGADRTKEYLDHLKQHDWKSDPETFPPNKDKIYREIETRLRTFERVPYRKG
jgi:hypothetical protein